MGAGGGVWRAGDNQVRSVEGGRRDTQRESF